MAKQLWNMDFSDPLGMKKKKEEEEKKKKQQALAYSHNEPVKKNTVPEIKISRDTSSTANAVPLPLEGKARQRGSRGTRSKQQQEEYKRQAAENSYNIRRENALKNDRYFKELADGSDISADRRSFLENELDLYAKDDKDWYWGRSLREAQKREQDEYNRLSELVKTPEWKMMTPQQQEAERAKLKSARDDVTAAKKQYVADEENRADFKLQQAWNVENVRKDYIQKGKSNSNNPRSDFDENGNRKKYVYFGLNGNAGMRWNELTDAEKEYVDFLYGFYSSDVDTAERKVKALLNDKDRKFLMDKSKESGLVRNFVAPGTNVLTNLVAAPMYMGEVLTQGAKNVVSGLPRNMPTDTLGTQLMETADASREAFAGDSKIKGFALDMVNSVTPAMFGAAAPVVYGMQSGGRSAYDTIKKGGSVGQAGTSAVMNATVSGIISKYGFDELFKGAATAKNALKSGLKNTLLEIFVKHPARLGGAEALEEGVESYADTIIDMLVNGDNSDMARLYNAHIKNGHTPEQAQRMTLTTKFLTEPGVSAALGGLMGAFMGEVNVAANVGMGLVGHKKSPGSVSVDVGGVSIRNGMSDAEVLEQLRGKQSSDQTADMQYKIQYDNNGNPQEVIIEEDIFKGHEDENPRYVIRDYLKENIGASAKIIESGQRVYLGEDLPGEYSYSEKSRQMSNKKFKAKGQATQNLLEMVEIAENRSWKKNEKDKHNVDAKYGWYKYTTHFNAGGKSYSADLLIRNDANGKKYLYDVINIKNGAPLKASNHNGSAMANVSSYTNNTTGADESQGKFAYKDADVPNTPLADALGNIDINSIYGDGENNAGNDFQMATPHPSAKADTFPSRGRLGERVELKGRSEFGSDEAYAHYINEVGQKEFAKVPKITRAFLEAIARRTGLKIVIGDTGTITGQKSAGGYSRSRDMLVLDYDTVSSPDKLARAVINHELVHATETSMFYKSLEKHAFEQMFGGDEKALNDAIKKKQERYARSGVKLGRDGAKAELVARYIGESVLTSEAAINRLVIEKPTLAMQIKNALVKTYDKAKTYFTDKEAYEAKYVLSDLEKGIKLFEKALDTRRNFKDFVQRLSGNTGGDVQYDIRKDKKGTEYWHVDTEKDIFKGIKDNTKLLQKRAFDYLLSNNKRFVVEDVVDGERLKFVRIAANKYVYGDHTDFLSTENYNKKMRMTPSIYDLIENSTSRWESPNHKELKKINKYGYKNYAGYVEIDNVPFHYIVRVGKGVDGKYFYEMNLEVSDAIEVPDIHEDASLRLPPTSKEMISQSKPIVKSQMQEALEKAGLNDWQRAKPVVHGMRKQALVDSNGNTLHIGDRVITEDKAEGVVTMLDKYGNAEVTFEIEDNEYIVQRFSSDDDYNVTGLTRTDADRDKKIVDRIMGAADSGSADRVPSPGKGLYEYGARNLMTKEEAERARKEKEQNEASAAEPVQAEIEDNLEGAAFADVIEKVEREITEAEVARVEVTESAAEVQQEKSADENNVRDSFKTVKAKKYYMRQRNEFKEQARKVLGVPGKSIDKADVEFDAYAKEFIEKGAVSAKTKDALFEKLWSEGVIIDDSMSALRKEIREKLKKQTIYIDERDSKDIPGFDVFRLYQAGNMAISTKKGYPIDAMYQELSETYSDLFPERITASSDRLVRVAQIMQNLKAVQMPLDKMYTDVDKAAFKKDFEKKLETFNSKLGYASRYDNEAGKVKANEVFNKLELTTQDALNVQTELKKYKNILAKVQAKHVLTYADIKAVENLLNGQTTEEQLNPALNIEGIKAVYKAKLPVRHLEELVAGHRDAVKKKYRSEAERFVANSDKWRDKGNKLLGGLRYARETMERNMQYVIGNDAEADKFNEHFFEPVHINEAKATRFKNEYRDRVTELKLSDKVAKGNKTSESFAVQFVGEMESEITRINGKKIKTEMDKGRLAELNGQLQTFYAENPNLDTEKINKAVEEFRKIYNELFEGINAARVQNGYQPMEYRQGYFPHFLLEEESGVFEKAIKALGVEVKETNLPTAIAGKTQDFKPGIRFMTNALQRKGNKTDYDAVMGFDRYIETAADVIYHTEDIQKLRALEDAIRFKHSEAGIDETIEKLKNDNSLTFEDKSEQINELKSRSMTHLGGLVQEISEYANLLANKKSKYDRTWESIAGRKVYNLFNWANKRVAVNMIAGNLSSAATNFIPITQASAEVGYGNILKAAADTLKSGLSNDGFADRSTFLTNRRGSDILTKTKLDKAADIASKPMEWIDMFTSNVVTRAKYEQNIKRGMSEAEAMRDADKFAAGLIADRSKGALPTIFAARNPLAKGFTMFQVEVNNQLSYLFKDLPKAKRNGAVKSIARALFSYFIGANIYNYLYKLFFGREPALDPIGLANDVVGGFAGVKARHLFEVTADLIRNGGLEQGQEIGDLLFTKVNKSGVQKGFLTLGKGVADQLPFAGVLTGGGRIPVSSGAVTAAENVWGAVAPDTDKEKRKQLLEEAALSIGANYAMPFGGNQLKKTINGIRTFKAGGSYRLNNKGEKELQYPVFTESKGELILKAAQAGLFGKSALPEAQRWVDNGFDTLSADDTARYDKIKGTGSNRELYETLLELGDTEPVKNNAGDTIFTKNQVRHNAIKSSKIDEGHKAWLEITYWDEDKQKKAQAASDVGISNDVYVDMNHMMSLENKKYYENYLTQRQKKMFEATPKKEGFDDYRRYVLMNDKTLSAEQKRYLDNDFLMKEGNVTQYDYTSMNAFILSGMTEAQNQKYAVTKARLGISPELYKYYLSVAGDGEEEEKKARLRANGMNAAAADVFYDSAIKNAKAGGVHDQTAYNNMTDKQKRVFGTLRSRSEFKDMEASDFAYYITCVQNLKSDSDKIARLKKCSLGDGKISASQAREIVRMLK